MTDAPATSEAPQPSTSAPTDPSPGYAHGGTEANSATHPKKPTIDTSTPTTAHERAATAESTIPHSATSRLSKNEVKDAKRVSKVLKNEGRTDAKVLKAALTEFESLQRLHKNAAKDEAVALSAHGKATKVEHKMNMCFLDAQAKHDAALTDLRAHNAALNATKEHARKQSEQLRKKEAEIQDMHGRKAIEDREREAKLKQLTMSPTSVSPV